MIARHLKINSIWSEVSTNSLLLSALADLSPDAQIAIHLRFWENATIEQIADHFGLGWSYADKLINDALSELKVRLTVKNNKIYIPIHKEVA